MSPSIYLARYEGIIGLKLHSRFDENNVYVIGVCDLTVSLFSFFQSSQCHSNKVTGELGPEKTSWLQSRFLDSLDSLIHMYNTGHKGI